MQKMDYKKFTCIRKLTLKLFAEKYISLQKMGWRKLQLRINEKVLLKTIYRYIICNTLFVNHILNVSNDFISKGRNRLTFYNTACIPVEPACGFMNNHLWIIICG